MALPTITNNSPSAGYIKWTAFGIQYNGQAFSIPAGQTNNKFVWWKYNGGTAPALVQGNEIPASLTPDDIVLFMNKSGIGTLVPTTQVIDGSLVVSGSILADGIGANQIQSYHVIANAITGEKISANAVTAQHILAGSITTEKLSVGAVGDNMIANGSFEDGTQGWNAVAGAGGTADIVTGVASSGAYALRIIRGTTNKEVQQLPQFYVPVTANAGTKWYVTCQAGAGAAIANGFYFRVMWYQADKATAASTVYTDVAANVALGTTWGNFEAQVTPPANARYMAIRLINANTTTTMYVDSVAAHEVITSAVIGDGQITTPKMVANSISGDRITANTLHADKIIANTITADKLSANAIDGKTITGATIRSAATGQRTEIVSNKINFFTPQNATGGAIYGVDNGAAGGALLLGTAPFEMTVGRSDIPGGGTAAVYAPAGYMPTFYTNELRDPLDNKVFAAPNEIGVFTLNTLYQPHASWQNPTIEKVGSRCHFHGTITTKGVTAFLANAAYVMGTLPVGFRPAAGKNVFQPAAASPGITAWVGAYSAGTVEFALTNATSATTNSWILGFDLWFDTV